MKIHRTILLAIFGMLYIASYGASLYINDSQKDELKDRIEHNEWFKNGIANIKSLVDSLVAQHENDPSWIVSRFAMYWKDSEHYTQCYLKNQNWDRGEGNAPVPTVRMPGMRTWNKYKNVPLSERTPYNESGDMWGIDITNPNAGKVLVPYKESGHMIRSNNNEILSLAENAAFIYWLEGDERYATFASDIFYNWLIGTYYMNPILDSKRSSGGSGGYEPGGILGYYDYEQIHDDLAMHGAAIYDFLKDYLTTHPSNTLIETGKSLKDVVGEVFKRFIDIGFVRGGKSGNWNVNGWNMILRPILVLENNDYYADKKGRDYYIKYLVEESTPYHDAIPDIIKSYNSVTGLWPESPGYAFSTINMIIDFADLLRSTGIDIINREPMLQKAALSVLSWMDSKGNLPVFGDCRGGSVNYATFESLLSYYTQIGDSINAQLMNNVIIDGINKGTYKRDVYSWENICRFTPLKNTHSTLEKPRISYSTFHRFAAINSNNSMVDMSAFIYGGRNGSHLSANGLAVQLFWNGYAIVPDAAGYESYWSEDYLYHQSPTGSNTILPGYTDGNIEIIASDPRIDSLTFTSNNALSSNLGFIEMSAAEKRRLIFYVAIDSSHGYYVDIFRSAQMQNDYLLHAVGNSISFTSLSLKRLSTDSIGYLPQPWHHKGYKWLNNVKKVSKPTSDGIIAEWNVGATESPEKLRLYIPGDGRLRDYFAVDAPYTTLSKGLTPDNVSSAPYKTPTLLIRQNNVDGWSHPFICIFEPININDSSVIKQIKTIPSKNADVKSIHIQLNDGTNHNIISNISNKDVRISNLQMNGQFAFYSTDSNGNPHQIYLINGSHLKIGEIIITAKKNTSLAMTLNNGKWQYSATGDATITIGKNRQIVTSTL